jgi:hypothetical protein
MLLNCDRLLADSFARKIPFTAEHLVISQNLLPYIWREGWLGGRTFDVLMTRLPLRELEHVLDRAAAEHPESRTLSDFRAPADLREAETGALAAARAWVTPHSRIAALAGNRAVKLEWKMPATKIPWPRGHTVVFPATTVARKGCYEMREMARRLGLRVRLGGHVIEDAGFWQDLEVSTAEADWMDDAGVVVLPAWVEHWPRRLLRALAAGVPVVASNGCGLAGLPNLREFSAGDLPSLVAHVAEILHRIPA